MTRARVNFRGRARDSEILSRKKTIYFVLAKYDLGDIGFPSTKSGLFYKSEIFRARETRSEIDARARGAARWIGIDLKYIPPTRARARKFPTRARAARKSDLTRNSADCPHFL